MIDRIGELVAVSILKVTNKFLGSLNALLLKDIASRSDHATLKSTTERPRRSDHVTLKSTTERPRRSDRVTLKSTTKRPRRRDKISPGC